MKGTQGFLVRKRHWIEVWGFQSRVLLIRSLLDVACHSVQFLDVDKNLFTPKTFALSHSESFSFVRLCSECWQCWILVFWKAKGMVHQQSRCANASSAFTEDALAEEDGSSLVRNFPLITAISTFLRRMFGWWWEMVSAALLMRMWSASTCQTVEDYCALPMYLVPNEG